MKKLIFILLTFVSLSSTSKLLAKECLQKINALPGLKYDLKQIIAPKGCTSLKVTLINKDTMGKSIMGHNFILALAKNKIGIANDGALAGLKNDYIKKNDKRVIAKTKLLGAGETDSVTIDLTKLQKGGKYIFFCSFPGHVATMNGPFKYN